MRYRLLFIVLILSASIAVYGCGDSSGAADEQYIKAEAPSTDDAKGGVESNGDGGKSLQAVSDKFAVQPRKLVYTANLRLRVDGIEESGKTIRAAVMRAGGYVSREEYERSTYSQQVSAVFRVPAEKFDATLKEIAAAALTVESRNVKAEDITAEFIDVSARLAAKKDVEARYRELLKQAKTISEILEIEEKISIIRSEVDASQGRLNYLSNQELYSTIEVVWYEPSDMALPEDSFLSRFVRGISNGWNGAIGAFIGIVNMWPFLLILALCVYFVRRIIRRSRRQPVGHSAENKS